MAIMASVMVGGLVLVDGCSGLSATAAQLLPLFRYREEIDTDRISAGFAPMAAAGRKNSSLQFIGPRAVGF